MTNYATWSRSAREAEQYDPDFSEPPHDTNLEQELLGCLITTWPAKFHYEMRREVVARLQAEDFYHHEHQRIFRCVVELAAMDQAVDPTSINAELVLRREMDYINQGHQYIWDVSCSAVPIPSAIPSYIKRIRDLSLRRQYIAENREALRAAYQAGGDLAALQRKIADASRTLDQAGGAVGPVSAASVYADDPDSLDAWREQRHQLRYATKFAALDSLLLGGMLPGELTIVGARPSIGKSALALAIARAVVTTGAPVVYFSLEMGRRSLLDRLICIHGSVNASTLGRGGLDAEEFARYRQVRHAITTWPLYIQDRGKVDLASMRAACHQIAAQHSRPLGLLVIDYLQLIPGDDPKLNQTQHLDRLTNGIASLAKELNAPALVLSQLSRAPEARGNRRPTLADLRDSGGIEQAADVCWLLYREDVGSDVAEVNVAKHRAGPTGLARLGFRSEFVRFEDLA